jgi:hypothetical protein|nr:MAG TPA: hypothetical protein [Caudoviricetes sp.]DAQ69398.1 MAG TPA: hypothetical protein [Caudoviricetes sp.]
MTLTLGNDEFNTLAEIIAKKVAESIKGCVPEKVKEEAVKAVKEETVETKKEVKEEAVESKKEEEPLYKQEDIRKAVMAFTRESPDNLAKTKGILSDLGLTQLTQLKGELITQFAEKFREAGGKL